MSQREHLICEVREQKKRLKQLIGSFADKKGFDQDDCYTFEITTKEVERNLRRINYVIAGEFLKNLTHLKYDN